MLLFQSRVTLAALVSEVVSRSATVHFNVDLVYFAVCMAESDPSLKRKKRASESSGRQKGVRFEFLYNALRVRH